MRRNGGVVLALVVALCLATLRIGDEPLWRDEVASIDFASEPVGDLARTVLSDEANMGPYYVAAHAWLKVDDSPEWVRALSVIGGLVSIATVALLARRWFDARTAFIAPVLLALHPFFLDYLTEARAYSWSMAAVLLGSLAIERNRVRPLPYGVAIGLACALNAVNALFLVAHAVALLALRPPRQMWHQLCQGAVIAAIVFAPFARVLLLRRGDQTTWIADLSPIRVAAALKDLSGGDLLAVTTAAMLMVYSLTRLRSNEFGPVMAIGCVAVPIAALAAVSLVQPLFVDRFLIAVVPFFVLVAADLAARARRSSLVVGAAATLLLIGGWRVDQDRPRDFIESEA